MSVKIGDKIRVTVTYWNNLKHKGRDYSKGSVHTITDCFPYFLNNKLTAYKLNHTDFIILTGEFKKVN